MHYKLAITVATLSILYSHDAGYLNESIDTEKSTTINVDSKIEKRNVDKWVAIDKAQHFMYSIFVSLGCQYVIVNKLKEEIQNRAINSLKDKIIEKLDEEIKIKLPF